MFLLSLAIDEDDHRVPPLSLAIDEDDHRSRSRRSRSLNPYKPRYRTPLCFPLGLWSVLQKVAIVARGILIGYITRQTILGDRTR
jgi:hypothetical protein